MNDDALKQMLRRADSGDGVAPPKLSADALLAAALRRRRRSTRRKAVASLALLGVLLAGAWGQARRGRESFATRESMTAQAVPVAIDSRPHAASIPNADELWLELARLDREADLRMQIVQAAMQPAASTDDAPPLPLRDADLVRLESARSAAMSWEYATLVERERQDLAAARREYQRLVDRFPNTPWASLAETSLRRLSAATN